jgi:hypothetical protein
MAREVRSDWQKNKSYGRESQTNEDDAGVSRPREHHGPPSGTQAAWAFSDAMARTGASILSSEAETEDFHRGTTHF